MKGVLRPVPGLWSSDGLLHGAGGHGLHLCVGGRPSVRRRRHRRAAPSPVPPRPARRARPQGSRPVLDQGRQGFQGELQQSRERFTGQVRSWASRDGQTDGRLSTVLDSFVRRGDKNVVKDLDKALQHAGVNQRAAEPLWKRFGELQTLEEEEAVRQGRHHAGARQWQDTAGTPARGRDRRRWFLLAAGRRWGNVGGQGCRTSPEGKVSGHSWCAEFREPADRQDYRRRLLASTLPARATTAGERQGRVEALNHGHQAGPARLLRRVCDAVVT